MVSRKVEADEARLPMRAIPARIRELGHDAEEADDQSTCSNGEKKEEPITVIFASLLIPGDGEPEEHSAIVIQGKTIKWVGSQTKLPPQYKNCQPVEVPVLMPGLWDCHVHFFGANQPPMASAVNMHFADPAQAGARNVRSAYDLLMSGFTSVRCAGGYGPELGRVIDEGLIPGPNIYAAGAALSQTAGHGDVFQLPLSTVQAHNNVDNVSICVLADGLDECRKAVRAQIRRGAKVIKVLASGGISSRDDDPMYQQFSDEELTLIVSEAKRMGRSVLAHVHGKAPMLAAIRAGCISLEHGSYLDDEVASEMKEAGTIFVPTRSIVEQALQNRDKLDPEQRSKLDKVAPYLDRAYRTALNHGLIIAFGTDSAGPPGAPLGLGSSASELKYGVKFGMTCLEAIKCATVNAVLTIGDQAPCTGQICEGYEADVIAVQKNPLDDIEILMETSNISHVWKGGKLWKKDGVGSFLGYE